MTTVVRLARFFLQEALTDDNRPNHNQWLESARLLLSLLLSSNSAGYQRFIPSTSSSSQVGTDNANTENLTVTRVKKKINNFIFKIYLQSLEERKKTQLITDARDSISRIIIILH